MQSCRKEFYEVTWATVRAHTSPSIADRILVPYQVRLTLLSPVSAAFCTLPTSELEQPDGVKLELLSGLSDKPLAYQSPAAHFVYLAAVVAVRRAALLAL